MSIHNIEVCEPKSVNSIYNIKGVNSLGFGDLHVTFSPSAYIIHIKGVVSF